MFEFNENRNEMPVTAEFTQISEYQSSSFDNLMKEVNDFIAETNDMVNGLAADTKEAVENVREYGLR